jgi:SAM-dependent methyltransferase
VRTNAEIWSEDDFVDFYAGDELRPVETLLLERYREALAGRLLELGCGAGRLTGHLIGLGGSVHGLDLSPSMVEHCRRTYPRGSFSEGDLRDLSRFPSVSLDAVFAPFNVIDVLGDEQRRGVLDGIRRVLTGEGLLIFSSHNRDYASRIGTGLRVLLGSPRRPGESIRSLPRRLRNRRALRPLERSEPGYSIRNDEAHDFSLLHYYISRDDQERQLAEHGFELLECRDLDGVLLPPHATAARSPELHYVARPAR